MQLNMTTDYALRVVMHLAVAEDSVTSKELSEKLLVPQSLIFKICKKLAQQGIVKIATGAQGGFSLLKSPAEITMHDIIDLFESTIRINRCMENDRFCNRCSPETCPVHLFYDRLQKSLEEELSGVTIQELLKGTNKDGFLPV